jgi:rhamnogalacturonan endolyase
VAYLDGKTPSLIVERGTYNLITLIAYQFRDGKLREQWRWDNSREPKTYWGQGAHWMHAADVDGDGCDELVIGSAVIDHNGKALWSTGLGHPDHCYVGAIDPSCPGLQIYYGIETRQKANGMCLVDAATGKILWGLDKPTRHVHSHGLSSDIDAAHPGSECYSADTDPQKNFAFALMHDCRGRVISEENLCGFGPWVVYWDADLQRELLHGSRIWKYKGPDVPPKIEGKVAAVADVLGDWREEIITSLPGELRIYTTTIPAADRRVCLMQDPLYRMDVVCAAMGYYQVPMTNYDLTAGKRR